MSRARPDPKVHDPIAPARRHKHGEQRTCVMMQPLHLSLVIGRKGSGVSTLLKAFAERADMQDTLIVDGLTKAWGLPGAWNTDTIAAWLNRYQQTGRGPATTATSHIVLAASDLRAPRNLLRAPAEPKLGTHFRLSAVTAVASALTCPETADWVCAGSVTTSAGADELEPAIDPQLGRLFAIADRIVLTHTDQADPAAVKRLATTLKALNPPAPILRGRYGDIGPARLVDTGLFDPLSGSVDIDRWLCEAAFGFEASRRGTSAVQLNEVQSTLGRSAVRFFAITIDQPINSTVLSVFLKLLMADRAAALLRLKGIIAAEEHPDRPALIDGREHIIQPLLWLPAWPTAGPAWPFRRRVFR